MKKGFSGNNPKGFEGLEYSVTNENLEAVVEGLMAEEDDVVLSVGGSGYQAFALLEKAKMVIAADTNPAQINYIRQRANDILSSDYESFFNPGITGSSDGLPGDEHSTMNIVAFNRSAVRKYFESQGRIERLKEKLSKNRESLSLRNTDILSVALHESGFNKIYLSNVVGYLKAGKWHGSEIVDVIAEKLPPEGLVYISNGRAVDSGKILTLSVDEKLTETARKIQAISWLPSVYRKKASL